MDENSLHPRSHFVSLWWSEMDIKYNHCHAYTVKNKQRNKRFNKYFLIVSYYKNKIICLKIKSEVFKNVQNNYRSFNYPYFISSVLITKLCTLTSVPTFSLKF